MAMRGLPHPSVLLVATGAAFGFLLTLLLTRKRRRDFASPALRHAEDRRRLLPRCIILVRHGESEANADKRAWRRIPDNLLGLTERGREQSVEVGERVEAILNKHDCRTVHLVVSPFERTLQTASAMRAAFEHRVVRTDIESRIREQEVGNLQGEEFQRFREEQKRVGRFWYRFPTGESGADVCDRVKSWWYESVLNVNVRVGYKPIDAMVIATHGLTMRFILMQLFGWSPTTFHSVWNAGNCDMYVLPKDLTKPGTSPYVLDEKNGDMPRSSIDVMVEYKHKGKPQSFKLENYLTIPPPRTTRIELVKQMLAMQYPSQVKENEIESVVFMPFIQGGIVKGRSTSGVASAHSRSSDLEIDDRLCSGEISHCAPHDLSLRLPFMPSPA